MTQNSDLQTSDASLFNKIKMNVDTSLQAAGLQCGVDVESLFKKYSGVSVKQNSDSGPIATAHNSTSDTITGEEKTTETEALNRLRICKGCHGYGLVKERYNHQVKEVNCGECEGEGIVEMNDK